MKEIEKNECNLNISRYVSTAEPEKIIDIQRVNKELNKIKSKIAKKYKPEKIILFGSYAWERPKKDSDADLFLIKNTRKKFIDRSRDVSKILLDRTIPIDILVYTPKEIKQRLALGDMFIAQILKKGNILYER